MTSNQESPAIQKEKVRGTEDEEGSGGALCIGEGGGEQGIMHFE